MDVQAPCCETSAAVARILVVEDEVVVGLDLRRKLQALDYEVPRVIRYGEQVAEAVTCENPDLLLMDINLKGAMTGIEAARQLSPSRGIPVVFLTAFSDETTLSAAKEVNPYGFLKKPVNSDSLRVTLDMALYKARMEEKLRQSEERYRRIFENSVAGIYQSTPDGRFLSVNRAFAQMIGVASPEELLEQTTDIASQYYADPADRREFIRRLERDGAVENFEFRFRHADGSIRWLSTSSQAVRDADGRFLYYEGIDIDITEQKRLEHQLRQKFKMEAIGVMAGGVAHNFNNSLAIILGNLEMAQIKRSDPDAVDEYLGTAKTAVFRSRDLVQQILTYSRQGHQERESLQIVPLVKETRRLLLSILPSSIRLHLDIGPEAASATIRADASRIQEILLNLCNNAVQAMEESGRLTIGVEAVELSDSQIPAQYACAPGPYIRISVVDTGCGMDPETQEKIFDPFFTTKSVDQGTGMGLATVQGIVEQHRGLIRVSSRPGEGSVFEVYFPCTGAVADLRAEEPEELPQGSGRILLVDDDPLLADIWTQMLNEFGYQVHALTSSLQALHFFRQHPDDFDLVITDQTMPELSGMELIGELHAIRSGLPAVLCTGYSSRISEPEALDKGASAFLMKPLDPGELGRVLRALLTPDS